MVRRTICFLVIAFVGLNLGFAQTSAQSPIMPKKPKALMLMAAQLNGLYGIHHPWHIKANFQTYDPDGKPADTGVFEEWWAGPKKYKISYTSGHFNQTEYRNSTSDVVSGDTGWPPILMQMVHNYLVQPLTTVDKVEKRDFSQTYEKIGSVKMRCVLQTELPSSDTPPSDKICFGPGTPAVRVAIYGEGLYTIFNRIVRANGHYIAEQVSENYSKVPLLTVNVISLDFPDTINDAEFQPKGPTLPALPPMVDVGPLVGRRISGRLPSYPEEARRKHIQGTVVLRAMISKSGDVTHVQVISGPSTLRQYAVDTVRTWRFLPYLQYGHPVSVETQFNVVYTFGGQ